jgi:hypothetical protein
LNLLERVDDLLLDVFHEGHILVQFW